MTTEMFGNWCQLNLFFDQPNPKIEMMENDVDLATNTSVNRAVVEQVKFGRVEASSAVGKLICGK